MRDLVSNIGVVSVLAPALLTATATGTGIDLAGFDGAALIITTGAIAGTGDFTAKLQDSDVLGSGYADVAAADLKGTFPASLAADSALKVGYRGNKRFVRLVTTRNSGTSIAASAVLVKGNPRHAPVA